MLVLLLSPTATPLHATPTTDIPWRDWNQQSFDLAKTENKLVLLNVSAGWCHWCHVMDDRTYADPAVQKLIARHFVAIRVDADARPDLRTRYRDYGWPATVVLSASGTDLRKRAGFIEPAAMFRLLEKVHQDPSAELIEPIDSPPVTDIEKVLRERHDRSLDPAGGLRISQRYLDAGSMEWSLYRASAEPPQAAWYRKTLEANLQLLDPVWGGAYQYSTGGGWLQPHYEKIAAAQAVNIISYSEGFARFGDERFAAAARSTVGYVNRFWKSPAGTFYASQDADLEPGKHAENYFQLDEPSRTARGIPRIDTNVYADINGMLIEAFAHYAALTGDRSASQSAAVAADKVWSGHRLPSGMFGHTQGGPAYLSDTLWMGRGFLSLYRVTADRRWLDKAVAAGNALADFVVGERLMMSPGGDTEPTTEEIIGVLRFAKLLRAYSGRTEFDKMASAARTQLMKQSRLLSNINESGVLVALEDYRRDPYHATVIGSKNDPITQKLWERLLRVPGWYQRTEWWDPADGKLMNPVSYPVPKEAAAFVCVKQRCSLPLRSVEEIEGYLPQVLS